MRYDVEYYEDGSKMYEGWYIDGKSHRLDGPAYIAYYEDGSKRYEWWYIDGNLHRLDGPARIGYYSDGSKSYEWWYIDGKLHRLDDPARIGYYEDGSKSYEWWHIDGIEYTESEHKEILELHKSIVTRDHAIMNIRNESEFIRRRCQEVLSV
jgi:hypothetical protein